MDTVDAAMLVPSSDQFGSTVGEVWRCATCGHAAVADPPAHEVFEGAYGDADDPISIEEEGQQVATALRDLARIERFVSPGRLLDIGSWTGSFLVAAAARGWEGQGLEPSGWACARAEARGCAVTKGSLENIRLERGAYRAIVACDVIEHFIDPLAAILQLRDALEPEGVVFLATPDAGSTVARMLGARWWSVLPMHLHYFTRDSISSMLTRSGLVVEDMASHPKSFSVGYYADRLAAFLPVGGRLVRAIARSGRVSQRVIAPNLGDRMAVVARLPRQS